MPLDSYKKSIGGFDTLDMSIRESFCGDDQFARQSGDGLMMKAVDFEKASQKPFEP